MSCNIGEVTERFENELCSVCVCVCVCELCSFSNLSVTSPTSQLILQPFCRFTYITAHSPILPLLHLGHSSFSNPSFASPMSQALQLIHLASRPCFSEPPMLYSRYKKQSKHVDSPSSKKANAIWSEGKIMESVFREAKGILLIDYFPTGQTIMEQYYTNLLDQLQQKIRAKMPDLAWRRKSCSIRTICACTCVVTMEKIHELRFELLQHPPDMAPVAVVVLVLYRISIRPTYLNCISF